jgi:regulator of sirC expression with transglutaminase-like and TPR domain
MGNNSEINALIYLLDDEDNDVLTHVYNKLVSYGPSIIPSLEEAWSSDLTPATHERLEEIIHEIQFETTLREFKTWADSDTQDLITALFLAAKYFYPELKLEDVKKKMLKLRQSIWLELSYNQTPLEQIQIFNQVFYSFHKFTGTQSSNNFNELCINHVLETKSGNAVLLGMIYQILANELNLPIYGVTLSRHYVLAFCKHDISDFEAHENLEREVMFYINPINQGSIFSRNEIKDYLNKLEIEHSPKYFTPADNFTIVNELISYLIDLDSTQNNSERRNELQKIAQVIRGTEEL